MKNIAIYVRVSTEEQKTKGLSVDNQISALKEYCSEHQYNIYKIYNDAGISARKKYNKRPALLELISDCKDKKIDLILFTKLDRWFRSVADYYEVQAVLDTCKVPWKAIWEDYETVTSSGIFKVNIMLSVAQAEADRTSERMKENVKYRRDNGYFMGPRAPLGYKIENHKLVVDQETSDIVRAIFTAYMQSHSVTVACRKAAEFGKRMATSVCYRILTNEAYYGNAHGCKCPAYITKADHDKIIKTMKTRSRTSKHSDRIYKFSGIVRCGYCGTRMVARVNKQKKKDGSIYSNNFYSCNAHNDMRKDCPGINLSEKKIEKYLLSHLDEELELNTAKYNETVADTSDIEIKIAKLNDKLGRIGQRYEDGDIDYKEYSDKRFATMNEIAALKDKLSAPTPQKLPENWKDIYNELDPENQRAFWLNSVSEILITREDIKILFDF